MVEIKFRILPKDVNQLKTMRPNEIKHLKEIEGLFIINLGENFYGFYDEEINDKVEFLKEPIIHWLNLLNEAAQLLSMHSYIALHVIGHAFKWMEFIPRDDILNINMITVEPTIGQIPFVITKPFDAFKNEWNDKVDKNNFISEVVYKSELFVQYISQINEKLLESAILSKFIMLIKKTKEIYNLE